MGNENSQLTGLEIDEKAVEVSDFWIHSSASLYNDTVTSLSVFIGDSFVQGSLWTKHTPLEKMTKNLMLHRHPCILKYISSWNKGSKHYLVVEHVKPLAHAVNKQTPLQICIGLYSVLKAITFLHEKAFSSHNNICSASIYVTNDGSWKLGGLEYLCRLEDLTFEYLNKCRMHRYDKAVSPNEQTNANDKKYLISGAIDKYAFSILVQELLRSRSDNDDIPSLEEFKQFCKTELQNSNANSCSFSSILEHSYFTHDFIVIYSFLTELALKSGGEKREFFTGLVVKLRSFPEEIVARQLGELLLSRLVLLDATACKHLLPWVFKPRTENCEDAPLFSVEIFKENIVPKLLHIFCVRDAQIRLLLLTHFKSYINYFTKEQLQNHVLPELLIGIKDTNDHLVSVTLIALSDLVPILGAAVVIGGKRLRLFNDGRPKTVNMLSKAQRVDKTTPSNHTVNSNQERRESIHGPSISYAGQVLELPERLSPDGGEDDVVANENEHMVAEEDLDSWSDWDAEENNSTSLTNNEMSIEHLSQYSSAQIVAEQDVSSNNQLVPREISTDISSLDIKNLQNEKLDAGSELNYFLDMEPVIEKANKFFIDGNDVEEDVKTTLAMKVSEDNHVNEDIWGEDLSWVEN